MTHDTNARTPVPASTVPRTPRQQAAEVATGQFDALLELLTGLQEREWDNDTDCAGWAVRDIVAHLAGSCQESVHPWVFARHARAADRRYADRAWLDGLNQAQVDDRAEHTPIQLLAELRRLAPAAVRARRRLPGLLRRRAMPAKGGLPAGSTLGYLNDVIYPRDVWMHRVDIARATGRDLVGVPADAEVVAQVVRDIAAAWDGPAFTLVLSGAGGGSWRIGDGTLPLAAWLRAETVAAFRLLSGRPEPAGVFDHDGDAAVAARLARMRIAF